MKILVTGADGFLGSKLLELLTFSKHNFISISRRKTNLNGKEYCDLSDFNSVWKLLYKVKPAVIVNLAAMIDFGKNEQTNLFSVNSLLPGLLAEYCNRSDCNLVHASTIAANGSSNTFLSINSIEAPDTDYGKSKLLADENILASGCYAAIIRFGGIFGSNGPTHLGINKAITDAKLGIPPRLVGGGKALRNYIFVKDAAKAIMTSIDISLQGVFYAGGGGDFVHKGNA